MRSPGQTALEEERSGQWKSASIHFLTVAPSMGSDQRGTCPLSEFAVRQDSPFES